MAFFFSVLANNKSNWSAKKVIVVLVEQLNGYLANSAATAKERKLAAFTEKENFFF